MSEIIRGTSLNEGGDGPSKRRWTRSGNNCYVPSDDGPQASKDSSEVGKAQPWKSHWPPTAFKEGTAEKKGETVMRCNQGAAEGRPTGVNKN